MNLESKIGEAISQLDRALFLKLPFAKEFVNLDREVSQWSNRRKFTSSCQKAERLISKEKKLSDEEKNKLRDYLEAKKRTSCFSMYENSNSAGQSRIGDKEYQRRHKIYWDSLRRINTFYSKEEGDEEGDFDKLGTEGQGLISEINIMFGNGNFGDNPEILGFKLEENQGTSG